MAQTSTESPGDPFRAFFDAAGSDAWRNAILQQVQRFWQCQGKLLDDYQAFAQSLLERRRAATEATLESVRKMSACRDNAEWAQCYADWLSGSLSRLADDGRDVLEESMKVMSEITQTMGAGMSETADAAAATREAQADALSRRGAAIAETAAAMQAAAARMGRSYKPDEAVRP